MQPPTIYKPGKLGYLWNYLGSSLKSFAAALSPYMGGGDAGVKKYVALLRQSGTDSPVATVLENTIGGNPIWSRMAVGCYGCTFDNDFVIDKTFCTAVLTYNQPAFFCYLNVEFAFLNSIYFYTYDSSSSIDFQSGIDVGAYIEIRVYP